MAIHRKYVKEIDITYLSIMQAVPFFQIQVRCSLEDVADNLVCAQLARGEKEGQVVRSLCSTLQNTGSSSEIIATTMMASLRRVLEKEEPDIMKDIGRTMHEQGTESKSKEHFVYDYFFPIFSLFLHFLLNHYFTQL